MKIIYLTLLLVLMASGCGDEQPASEADSVNVGVSLLTFTHPFFQEMIEGMKAKAGASNVNLTILSGEFDVAAQKNQVSDFIVKQVDAIILCPTDSKAIGTAISEANEAGIPVFTADIAVLADGVKVESHVGIDNLEGGRMAGAAALEAAGGSGKFAIIDHPEVESVILRTRGFRQVIDEAKAAGADVEIVAALPASGAQDKAFRVMEDLIQAHPDLDVVFGINDETSLGAVAAIEKAGVQDRIQVVAIGGKLEARQAVKDGKLYADVVTYPAEIGRLVVEDVLKYMSGESPDPETRIPTTLYKKADAIADETLQ